MGAAYFGGMNVERRMVLQLPVAVPVHRPGKNNARIAGLLELRDVARPIDVVAHHGELQIGFGLLENAQHKLGIVLGLEAADVEHIAARAQAAPLQRLRACRRPRLGTINNQGGSVCRNA